VALKTLPFTFEGLMPVPTPAPLMVEVPYSTNELGVFGVAKYPIRINPPLGTRDVLVTSYTEGPFGVLDSATVEALAHEAVAARMERNSFFILGWWA
jgi:hypothetical protein